MANLVLGYSDWGDAATIDSSSVETSGLEAVNVQATQPTDYWESQTNTPFLVLDRGSAQAFNVVALLFTNVDSAGTWQVRSADTEANLTAAPDYDSGSVSFRVAGDDETWDRHHGLIYLSSAQTNRWLRIDLTLTSGEVLEAGRLVVGNFFQPTVNDQYGRRFSVRDPGTTVRTDGGALISDTRSRFLSAEVTLDFLSESELYANVFEFRRLRGTTEDLTLILDPEESTYLMQQIIYGKLTGDEPVAIPSYNRYRHRLRIEEML